MAEESQSLPLLYLVIADTIFNETDPSGPQAWVPAIARIAALHPHTSPCAKLSTADIARELP